MQEKSIGQCRHGQELRAFLLAPQTRTLESQFAFIKAPSKFDLPSACIRKDHAPGLFIGRNWLSGQQIPGGASFAPADHQPQGRVPMVGVRHRQRQHTGMHPAGTATIPDGALRPAAFAKGDAPGFASIALGVIKLVVTAPAQYEASGKGQ